ncbi:hypothetical protein [Streptomyces sp. LaPpAH-108]|nr:hypothetical protein [Streptomyces sp. LaPpAH-108]
MVVIALLLPVLLVLMLFGLDAFEDFLFTRPPDESSPDGDVHGDVPTEPP